MIEVRLLIDGQAIYTANESTIEALATYGGRFDDPDFWVDAVEGPVSAQAVQLQVRVVPEARV